MPDITRDCCETCKGKGRVAVWHTPNWCTVYRCPECGDPTSDAGPYVSVGESKLWGQAKGENE